MSEKRATELSAPMLSEEETIASTRPTTMHASEESLVDLAPHRGFGPGRPGNLVVAPEAAPFGTALLRREAMGTRQLGERLLAQVESQDVLFAELRRALSAMEHETQDGTRIALSRLVRTASEVLTWCDAVQLEMEAEGRKAVSGLQAVDLLDLVHDVVHDLSCCGANRPVYVTGHANASVFASVPALGRAIRLAIELLDLRIGEASALHVDVGDDEEGHFVRVQGSGEAQGEPTADRIDEFRDAVESAGVRVLPDDVTNGRAGMCLRLPVSTRGPLLPIR